jgi:spore germination protein GerM
MSSPYRCSFFIVAALMAAGTFGLLILNSTANSWASDQMDQNTQSVAARSSDKSIVYLYFSDKENSFLIAEQRHLAHSNNPAEFGKTILEALIQGPQEGLMRTIPEGSKLRAFYVTPEGTAYVDLTAALKDAHPGGIQSEWITIFSIVNSLILNISEIDAVKILIDGSESVTLAGHIDLRFPFRANMLLIR